WPRGHQPEARRSILRTEHGRAFAGKNLRDVDYSQGRETCSRGNIRAHAGRQCSAYAGRAGGYRFYRGCRGEYRTGRWRDLANSRPDHHCGAGRPVVLARFVVTAAISLLPLAAQTPQYTYRIIHVYPHDRLAFTQGLEFRKGFLYEGTGLEG